METRVTVRKINPKLLYMQANGQIPTFSAQALMFLHIYFMEVE